MARGFRLTSQKIRLTENDVERQLIHRLQYRHYMPVRLHSGLFPTIDSLCEVCKQNARWITVGEPGIPDYCVPQFFIEVKRPGGKLSEIQRQKIWLIEKQWDLRTAVISDAEEIEKWLDEYEDLPWKA